MFRESKLFGITPLATRTCAAVFLAIAAAWAPSAARAEPVPASIGIDSVTLAEGNSGITVFKFIVSLGAPAPDAGVTFDIGTADDTAIAGVDYEAKFLTGQTIAAGQTSYEFDVNVFGDSLVEPVELFLVNLTNISANALAFDTIGEGFIVNDDDGRNVPEPTSLALALAALSLLSLAAAPRRRLGS